MSIGVFGFPPSTFNSSFFLYRFPSTYFFLEGFGYSLSLFRIRRLGRHYNNCLFISAEVVDTVTGGRLRIAAAFHIAVNGPSANVVTLSNGYRSSTVRTSANVTAS